jgi:hypothetical protein
MATQKQIEANRRNAQRSTGPVTELGKGIAKFNALKHGMTASTAVLPYEDPISYAELRESFVASYKPANAVEAALVETVANSYWRLLRIRRVETATITLGVRGLKKRNNISLEPRHDDDMAMAVVLNEDDDTLRNIERHQTRIERCYFQAMETLRKMQKERLREERLTTAQPREIGFVSQARSARAPNAPSSPISLCTATPGEPHTANSTNDRSAILARKSSPEAGDRANR